MSKKMNAKLKSFVFKRDKYTCQYCGDKNKELCMDHIVPKKQGGANSPDNLTLSCIGCNSSKSNKSLLDFYSKRKRIYEAHRKSFLQFKKFIKNNPHLGIQNGMD